MGASEGRPASRVASADWLPVCSSSICLAYLAVWPISSEFFSSYLGTRQGDVEDAKARLVAETRSALRMTNPSRP